MFRLADAYLMYAEAVLRGGGGSRAQALSYVNQIRQRAAGDNSRAVTDAQLTLKLVLDERARCAAKLEAAVSGECVCEHCEPAIAAMVVFRRAVAGTDINGWWDNGANAIAFSRGKKGFVAISE
ncbi:MAG: RagB/SusD family nutrient uptake outer membrane protein [Gemmatimonadetes bacterium]|nr:RagB/SusD family nutrient uptake outer membrane protein [Gemmatimonadota bacterium]